MTVARRNLISYSVSSTVAGIRFFLRRSDLLPSACYCSSSPGSCFLRRLSVTTLDLDGCRHLLRLTILGPFSQQGPDDPRVFGRQRYGRDVHVPTLLECFGPGTSGIGFTVYKPQQRSRPVHQQHP